LEKGKKQQKKKKTVAIIIKVEWNQERKGGKTCQEVAVGPADRWPKKRSKGSSGWCW